MNPSSLELIFVSLLALALGLCVVFAFKMVLVLFAGVLFALVLRPMAAWIARVLRLPLQVALAMIVVGGVGLTVLAALWFAPTASNQLRELADALPKALDELRARLQHSKLAEHATAGKTLEHAQEQLSHVPALFATAVGGTVELLSSMVVVLFIGIYGAAEPSAYVRAALALTPKHYEARVAHALEATAHNLTRWLVGRLIAMLFVGVTTAIAFSLFGVPMAIVLGIVAGLLTFVEYVGAVASAIPPVLLVLSQGRTTTALGVLALYTVLHVIEGYVLTPLLARASVRIPPAIGIAFQALLATLSGPIALTFATPLLAVGISAAQAWRSSK